MKTESLQGTKLPRVTLPVTGQDCVTLPDDILGHWTLLYFYPKDDTSGCTRQACGYRDNLPEFQKLKVKIYGISIDDIASHNAFQKKHGINFPLISDPERRLSTSLNVYREVEREGVKVKAQLRDTFLVDPQGTIVRIWRGVDPTQTIEETYVAVQELATSGTKKHSCCCC